ncbi:glycosyltransferase [Falsiroseomonas ponticola]|uniref:glycosyltransferase n=1 Tax=Falsiroseomonas ponticola TaxID=2786951 RepID=UPI0019313C1E|nr:hypothetical protein [Roseomonas ponticola]
MSPDKQPEYFVTGVTAWVLQTYLRLKKAGFDVQLSVGEPIPPGVAITHSDFFGRMCAHLTDRARTATVSIRADRSPCTQADFEIVQNETQVLSERERFVHHWPQPGLKLRPADRGSRVEVASAKAFAVHPAFTGPAFMEALQQAGITWDFKPLSAVRGTRPPYTVARDDAWADYSGVDLIIALRDGERSYDHKPPTKLVNAWLAGTPAILGPESAYQALRQSDLDYIEAVTPEACLEAARALKSDPARYMAMIANGRRRAEAFSTDAICRNWIGVLGSIAGWVSARRSDSVGQP